MRNQDKKCCGRLKKSNVIKILGTVLYIFICLFGNIITGVFVYLNSLKEEDNESVAETILTSLDTSDEYIFDFDNDTIELDDFISALEEETSVIVDSYESILDENVVDVSYLIIYTHTEKWHFYFKFIHLEYKSQIIF